MSDKIAVDQKGWDEQKATMLKAMLDHKEVDLSAQAKIIELGDFSQMQVKGDEQGASSITVSDGKTATTLLFSADAKFAGFVTRRIWNKDLAVEMAKAALPRRKSTGSFVR